jgi:hypothetical protein
MDNKHLSFNFAPLSELGLPLDADPRLSSKYFTYMSFWVRGAVRRGSIRYFLRSRLVLSFCYNHLIVGICVSALQVSLGLHVQVLWANSTVRILNKNHYALRWQD